MNWEYLTGFSSFLMIDDVFLVTIFISNYCGTIDPPFNDSHI